MTENGGPVVDPTVVPASQASKETFGVVLVLDTSYSMTGKPLAAALAAEQAFVAQRNPNEQLGADRVQPHDDGRAAAHDLAAEDLDSPGQDAEDRRRHAHLRRRRAGRGDAQRPPTSARARSSSSPTAPTPAARRRSTQVAKAARRREHADLHDRARRTRAYKPGDAQGARGGRKRRVRAGDGAGPRAALRPARPAALERVPAPVQVARRPEQAGARRR